MVRLGQAHRIGHSRPSATRRKISDGRLKPRPNQTTVTTIGQVQNSNNGSDLQKRRRNRLSTRFLGAKTVGVYAFCLFLTYVSRFRWAALRAMDGYEQSGDQNIELATGHRGKTFYTTREGSAFEPSLAVRSHVKHGFLNKNSAFGSVEDVRGQQQMGDKAAEKFIVNVDQLRVNNDATTTSSGPDAGSTASYAQKREAMYNQDWEEELRRHPQLSYAPQRIPGYLHNCSRTLYGYVMRDLMTRLCPKEIGQTNVLVVSKDAPNVLKLLEQPESLQQTEEELRREVNFSVGGSTLVHAYKHEHSYYGLYDGHGTNNIQQMETLEEWWTNWGKRQREGSKSEFQLLLVDSFRSEAIMRSAQVLLEEATVKYIVLSFGSDPNHFPTFGMSAIQILLDHHYKVQLLSISHATEEPYNHDAQIYRPNADITREGLSTFVADVKRRAATTKQPVRGYIFATQGLDRAIPLATDYIDSVKINKVSYKQCHPSYTDIRFVPGNASQVQVQCNNESVAMPMQTTPNSDSSAMHGQITSNLKVARFKPVLWHSSATVAESEAVCTRLKGCRLPAGTKVSGKVHEFVAERKLAAKVACTTRILPKQDSVTSFKKATSHEEKPNLLVLMIDPISRARFERSLPKTSLLLLKLNFTSFSHYTAIANKSDPNQSAIYSGQSWAHNTSRWLWDDLKSSEDYATLKARDGCLDNNKNMIQPTVDHGSDFNRMMCFDFQRPNCLGGRPAASHLLEYASNFIKTYDRNKPWAAFLDFTDTNEDSQTLEGTLDELLWKYLYGFHAHNTAIEKSSLRNNSLNVLDNTIIALASYTGMDRGSYFQSPQGQRERDQPVLQIRLPPHIASTEQGKALESNKNFISTPLDVYATFVDLLLPTQAGADGRLGHSLVQPLPKERAECVSTVGLSDQACGLFQSHANSNTSLMPSPPSALSFYADVPSANKYALNADRNNPHNQTVELFLPGQDCMCATSHQEWHRCDAHPWSLQHGSEYNTSLLEYFSLVDCGGANKEYQVQVPQNPFILRREPVARAREVAIEKQPPSILFIEVDSVSRPYADRHLPKTRELLEKYRIRQTQTKEPSYECADPKWCSAEFKKFSVFGGPNSIPNQIGYMGGCITTTGPEDCTNRTIQRLNGNAMKVKCRDENHHCYGLELINKHRDSSVWCRSMENVKKSDRQSSSVPAAQSPWLFDIAKNAGFVTLFAEEFCYDGSPFVPQDNLFKLSADVLPHKFFCRMIERQVKRMGRKLKRPLYKNKGATDQSVGNVDGEGSLPKVNVSLSHIENFFNAYHDVPKFVYLNAMAAHVYSRYPTMTLAAEAYDTTLASFLSTMLERAQNTVIVVRSDHGHQGPPNNRDYASQIEALRPWTEILVPKNLPDISLGQIFHNQNRLITGADLYRALATLISSRNENLVPRHSDWTINFLKTNVPAERSCRGAKVFEQYCPSLPQTSAPNLGTCNLAEKDQDFLCQPNAAKFKEHLAADVDAVFNRDLVEETSCKSISSSPALSLQRKWDEIEERTATNHKAKPPKGISLHTRQTALLMSLVQLLSNAMTRPLTICETSFGAGHSAAMFLEASPKANLHVFDKFDQAFQLPILGFLKQEYPDHNITHYPGDTCKTVTETLLAVSRPGSTGVHCDVVHGSSLCPTDNIDLVERSPCGVLLTTTAMSSLRDNPVYFGPKGQWTNLRQRGCIRDISCYGEQGESFEQDVFNRSGANGNYSFCIAITTGKCQKFHSQVGLQEQACERGLAAFSNHRLRLSELCKEQQVPVPGN